MVERKTARYADLLLWRDDHLADGRWAAARDRILSDPAYRLTPENRATIHLLDDRPNELWAELERADDLKLFLRFAEDVKATHPMPLARALRRHLHDGLDLFKRDERWIVLTQRMALLFSIPEAEEMAWEIVREYRKNYRKHHGLKWHWYKRGWWA